MKLDKRLEGHLATLLEGYEANRDQVSQYIDQTSKQLDGARSNLQETEEKIADLKAALGLEDEEAMKASE